MHRVKVGKCEAIVRGENVRAQLDSQHQQERRIVSECLMRIFTTLRHMYLARQGLVLRGHNDSV